MPRKSARLMPRAFASAASTRSCSRLSRVRVPSYGPRSRTRAPLRRSETMKPSCFSS